MAGQQRNYFDVVTNAMEKMKHVENYIQLGISVTKDIAQDFLEINKDDSENNLDKLRDNLLGFLKMEADVGNFSRIVENTKTQYATGELPENLGQCVTDAFQGVNPPSATTLKSHQHYKDFEATIRELTNSNPGETSEETTAKVVLDEGDIVMTQAETIPMDPISKQEITDPVKNSICGHSYQRDTIMQHMQGRKARCPIVGCSNTQRLNLNHLQDDTALKILIERKNKAAERAKRMM